MALTTQEKTLIGGGLVLGGLGYYYYTKNRQKTVTVTKTSRSTVTSTQTSRTTPTHTVIRTNRTSTPTPISTAPSTTQCQSLNALGASNGFVNTATPAQVARMILANAQYQGTGKGGAAVYASNLVTPSSSFIQKSLNGTLAGGTAITVSSACTDAVTAWINHYLKTSPQSYYNDVKNYHFTIATTPVKIWGVRPWVPMVEVSSIRTQKVAFNTGTEIKWQINLSAGAGPTLNTPGAQTPAITHIAALVFNAQDQFMNNAFLFGAHSQTSMMLYGNIYKGAYVNSGAKPGYILRFAGLTPVGGPLYAISLWSDPVTLPSPTGPTLKTFSNTGWRTTRY